MLSISLMETGKASMWKALTFGNTSVAQCDTAFNFLHDWQLLNLLFAIVFDTTSSDTGRRTGCCTVWYKTNPNSDFIFESQLASTAGLISVYSTYVYPFFAASIFRRKNTTILRTFQTSRLFNRRKLFFRNAHHSLTEKIQIVSVTSSFWTCCVLNPMLFEYRTLN
jgi:hypothetical protein